MNRSPIGRYLAAVRSGAPPDALIAIACSLTAEARYFDSKDGFMDRVRGEARNAKVAARRRRAMAVDALARASLTP